MDAAVSIAIRLWWIDGVCALRKLRCRNPAGTPDYGTRKGLERYPFLPEAKKIQA
jgi:hypothetical protein